MNITTRLCIDCQKKSAAPGRRICWNCKLKRHIAKHPESVRRWNAQRNDRYKRNANGYRTRQLKIVSAYRSIHREEARKTSQEWREQYPERHANNHRRWRETHGDYIKQASQQYALLHPEILRHNSRLRKARLRQAKIGVFTPSLWAEQLVYFGYHCAYCLQPIDLITLDHMTPVVRGGLHSIENTVPCCMTCNSKKGNKNLLEWLLFLRHIPCKGIGNARNRGGRRRQGGASNG